MTLIMIFDNFKLNMSTSLFRGHLQTFLNNTHPLRKVKRKVKHCEKDENQEPQQTNSFLTQKLKEDNANLVKLA